MIQRVEAVLAARGAHAGTFSAIGEHAPVAGIRAGADAYAAAGADVIVSVGGGSPVDAAKAILHMLRARRGGALARQIAVPTTLSAAEYTAGAGFTDDDGQKVAVSDPGLAPAGIILDAELTLATPERLWYARLWMRRSWGRRAHGLH